jgi:hypothetical protein
MATKLTIYNGALAILGERKLANLTENREPRYKLDEVWDNDFIERVLQMGQWNFACRRVELTASSSVTPAFGYQYGFDKPNDFVRTMAVCYDEYFELPITRYSDESQWIFCDTEVIYYAYVSNDTQWGSDLTLWPFNFTEMAEHYLAMKVAPRLTGLKMGATELTGLWKMWLATAKATDAMEGPVKFAPEGSWSRSRRGRGTNDRGRRNQLIG